MAHGVCGIGVGVSVADADYALLAVARWERVKRRRALATAAVKWTVAVVLAPAAIAVAPLYALVVLVMSDDREPDADWAVRAWLDMDRENE